jgi:ankyrin repeat protein
MKELSNNISSFKMAFTTQILKGCVRSDIVKVVDRYLVPKNVTFKQMCNIGLVEQLLVYCLNNNPQFEKVFYSACSGGHLEIINIMIEKGADEWISGLSGACQGGHLEIVNLMIEKGANGWDEGLCGACQGGQLEMVNLMIEKGADDWNMGLYSACNGGHFAYGNPFCAKGTKRALLEANARSTRLEIANLMIKKGANDWNFGLRHACKNGHLEIVNLMIEKGATRCGNCKNHGF